jgi:hypothetical protein
MVEVLARPQDVRLLPKLSLPTGPNDVPAKISGRKRPRGESEYANGIFTAKPAAQVRGHTSYLTFATLLPEVLEDDSEDVEMKEESEVKVEPEGVEIKTESEVSKTKKEPEIIKTKEDPAVVEVKVEPPTSDE